MFDSHRTPRWRSNMSTAALKAVLCLLVVPVSGGFTPCGVKPSQLWTPATRQLGSVRGGAFTHKRVGPLAFKRGGAEERAVLDRSEGPLLKGDEKKLLVEKGGGEAGMTPLTVVRQVVSSIQISLDDQSGSARAKSLCTCVYATTVECYGTHSWYHRYASSNVAI